MRKEWDVVVVGGGPGGLWFAKNAAEKGLKVLVLERKKEIGTPVQCAEGFSKEGLEELGIEPDPRWKGWEVSGAKVYAPNGKYIEIPGEGYVIERKIFEKELAKMATRAGATVLSFHEVHDVIKEDGKVTGVRATFLGEEREFRANIVIAADGFESMIARKAGLKTFQQAYHADSGFEYQMAGINIDADNIHLFFGTEVAPRGYVWIFPTDKDTANVGIGIDARIERTARWYLDKWIEEHKEEYGFEDASIIEVRGGGIPVGGLLKEMTADGLMVVGDAAHQVHPLHGGGMFLAMEAGAIAAEVAALAHEKEDFTNKTLSLYNKLWWERRGNQLQRLVKIRQMFEKLTDDDFNFLVDILTPDDILAISEGEVEALKVLVKKLVKYPRLASLFARVIS